MQAERALEALSGCPRLVELDDLRLRLSELIEAHRAVKAAAVETEAKRNFADGQVAELRDQLRAANLEKIALVEQRTRLVDELARRWPWWAWASIGAAIGVAASAGTAIAIKKRQASP